MSICFTYLPSFPTFIDVNFNVVGIRLTVKYETILSGLINHNSYDEVKEINVHFKKVLNYRSLLK